jgi:hypothetical protein
MPPICLISPSAATERELQEVYRSNYGILAAEKLHRYWLGTEIADIEPAVQRLTHLENGQMENWESARGNKKVKI